MKWISVKDQLPEEGISVLAYAYNDGKNDFTFLSARYFEAYQYLGHWSERVDGCQIPVTHWMLLPNPPKE